MRNRLVALIAIAGLSLTSCTSTTSGTATVGASPDTQTKSGAGVIPDGLSKYYTQTLLWGSCVSYASTVDDRASYAQAGLQCARLTVPLDYAKPTGTTINLAVLRYRGSNQSGRIGSLLMNPGGPGESGASVAASMVKTYASTGLAAKFDLVGFDPRGIGASEPLISCLTDQEQDQQRAEDLDVDTAAAGVAKAESTEKDYAAKCAQRTTHGDEMLANVGTRDVAKDMDVLRSALGDAKLTYLGYSYGTRIGTEYAEQFPKNVRAMILDGAVDPTQSDADSLIAQAKGFQTAFDNFAQWCAKQGNCPLSSNATADYQTLTRALIDNPITLQDGRKLTYDDANTGAVQSLYSQSYWQYLMQGLQELKNGQGSTLMSLADSYNQRDSTGHYSATQDAFNAVHCVDDTRDTDRVALLKQSQDYKAAAPFLDDGKPAAAVLDSCAFWPVPVTDTNTLPTITGLAPTLVISTTNDPATPYQAGVNLAKDLGGSLLTYQGTQHTAFLQGITCVDNVGTAYLTNGTLPSAGKTCS